MTVSSQPFGISAPSLDYYHINLEHDEKGCTQHGAQWGSPDADSESGAHAHGRRCRCSRGAGTMRRRILAAALLALFSVVSLLLFSCLYDVFLNGGSWLSALGFGEDASGAALAVVAGLVRRQSPGNAPANDNGNNVFIDKKYYLIVIFVGLFLVILAGICLSAWCCKGAFENPLCCPCYLCACCGGLACLNCLACGLCGEALDQM